jgi:hypothetical protein
MLVYILKDQGIAFYVGKGTHESRAYSHEKYAVSNNVEDLGYGLKKDYNPRKTRKIRKLLREGRSVEYELIECKSDDEASDLEVALIKKYGRRNIDKNGILTNIHPGGSGGNIYAVLSDAQKRKKIEKARQTLLSIPIEEKNRRKIANSIIRQNRLASISSEILEERRRRLSEIRKAAMSQLSQEERSQRYGKAGRMQRGIKRGPSSKKGLPATKGNAKGVRQAWNKNVSATDSRSITHRQGIDNYWKNADMSQVGFTPFKLVAPSGEIVEGNNISWLIREYDLSARVTSLINGNVKTYKGWIRYEDLGTVTPRKTARVIKGGIAVPIDRYTLDGQYIDTWPTIKAAAKSLGLSSGTLSTKIQQGKPYHGYMWIRHGQPIVPNKLKEIQHDH